VIAAAGDQLALLNRAAASMALGAHSDAVIDCVAALGAGVAPVKAAARLCKALVSAGALEPAAAVLEASWGLVGTTGEDAAAELLREAEGLVAELRAAAGSVDSAVIDAAVAPESVGAPRRLAFGSAAAAEAAASALSAAVAVAPAAPRLAFALAVALLEAGRPETAVAVARSLDAADASSADGTLGSVPDSVTIPAGHADAAPVSVALASAAAAPPPASALLAHALACSAGFEAASAQLQADVSRDPDGSTPAGAAAIALRKALHRLSAAKDAANEQYKAGKYADAAAAYAALADQCAAELGSVPSFVHANVAAAQLSLGQAEHAVAACDRALAAWPFNAKAWLRRAACLQGSKPADHEGAAADLVVAQHLQPEDASLHAKLFQARAKAGIDPDDDSTGLLSHPQDDTAATALLWPKAAASGGAGGRGKSGASAVPPLHPSSAASAGTGKAASASAARAPRLSIVDCFATWCGPCKTIAPSFAKAASAHAIPQFAKVDGDRCRATVTKLGVRAFPTFIALLDGVEVDRLEGADPGALQALISKAIAAWQRPAKGGAASATAGGGAGAAAAAALAAARRSPELSADVVAVVGARLREIAA
jgi:thioredoxin 1